MWCKCDQHIDYASPSIFHLNVSDYTKFQASKLPNFICKRTYGQERNLTRQINQRRLTDGRGLLSEWACLVIWTISIVCDGDKLKVIRTRSNYSKGNETLPHKCTNSQQNCPTKSPPKIIEAAVLPDTLPQFRPIHCNFFLFHRSTSFTYRAINFNKTYKEQLQLNDKHERVEWKFVRK